MPWINKGLQHTIIIHPYQLWNEKASYLKLHMLLYNDVIDRNMDQFNKETNESHDGKTDGCSKGNFLKF